MKPIVILFMSGLISFATPFALAHEPADSTVHDHEAGGGAIGTAALVTIVAIVLSQGDLDLYSFSMQ